MVRNVAYTVGGDFWIPCGVSIYSLVKNNPGEDFDIYVLSEEPLDQDFADGAKEIMNSFSGVDIEYLNITQYDYDTLPEMGKDRIAKGANTKLLLGDVLPLDDDNVLFLDADTVVASDISDLLDRDMSQTGIAAAPGTSEYIAGLGVPLDRQYFCAGVMYLNLEYWGKYDIKERCFEFIEGFQPRLTEQTSLNAVFHKLDLVDILPLKFNVNASAARGEKRSDEILLRDPSIIHYSGVTRPWHQRSEHPFTDVWIGNYKESPYTGFYPQYRRSRIINGISDVLEYIPGGKQAAREIMRSVRQ